jgi:uncharacterized protein YkwD
MKKAIGVLVSALILLTLLTAVPLAGAASVRLANKERLIVDLVNEERAERGLRPLVVRLSLVRAARGHSRAMASVPFFSHVSPDGRTPSQRVTAAGYRADGFTNWRVGENIAWGTGVCSTAEATVHNWMKSPCHRRTILAASFRDVGVGTACGTFTNGQVLLDNVTYFTIDFGRRSR